MNPHSSDIADVVRRMMIRMFNELKDELKEDIQKQPQRTQIKQKT
jgi:hypothetical protein